MRRELVVLAAAVSLVTVGCGDSNEIRAPAPEREEAKVECPPRTQPRGGRVVTLFHETHTHGNLAGTPEPGRPREHDVSFARYVGLIDALRSCLADPDAALFVGNGDDLSRDVDGYRTDGRHTIDAFNAAGLTADTFGFSEVAFGEHYDSFGEGLNLLRELIAGSDFAWVSANVRDRQKPEQPFGFEQGARRFVVQDVAGVRVGITGLLSATFSGEGSPPLPGGVQSELRVLNPVTAMREVVPEMRAAGADVVVVLSHMIHDDMLRVARAVDGIDVAIGTHLGPPLPTPRVVNGTIVAIAGPDELQGLGQLDLVVRRGRVADFSFRRHVPSSSGPVDRDVETAIAEYVG
jgi:2',3'-cyclic-nucleotide 2'-phosphodiesterase (5'-nucleotidase family)